MRILRMHPFTKDSHLNPRRRKTAAADARRVDADEPRDQAGDEKRPMSTQETMSHDGNRLAGEG